MQENFFRMIYFFLFYGISCLTGMLIPFLNNKGFDPIMTGSLIGFFTMFSVGSQFLTGYFCDRYKTIKKILIFLIITTTVSGVFSIFFNIGIIFYISFFILGFSSASLASLVDSFVLESEENIKSKFGKLRSFASIGWASGVLMSGIIVSNFGYNFVAIISTITLSISIFLISRLNDVKKDCCDKISLKPLIININYDFILLTLLIICISFRCHYQLIPYSINYLGGDTFHVGLYYFISSISEIIMLMLTMSIMHKISPDKLLIITPIALFIQLVTIYFANNLIFIFISASLQVFTYPIIIMVGRIIVDRVSPTHLRTTSQLIAFAVYNSFAMIIASFLIGFLVDYSNIKFAILCVIAITFISFIMSLFYDRNTIDKTL